MRFPFDDKRVTLGRAMKNRLLIGLTVAFMILTGCAGASTLTYTVGTNIADNAKSMELFQASERVMIRKLAGNDIKDAQVTVVPSGSGSAVMTLKLPDAKAADIARAMLSETFTFDIRLEGPKTPGMSEGETNWVPTGVDGSTLLWIYAISNPDTQEIGAELVFNEQGQNLLQAAFTGNKGKSVGIFVRDLLVSKMTITDEVLSSHILISGIPSEHVAQIFADDVNVGLHAIFTPTK